ncbi:MAG TPA: TonB-dependent receptor [Phenylobacterium sp.]|uniref:TonB-dependent receptor n=1 Tax=Phenylobacterium sp. TaxID=1871053 RepID=UPI002B465BEF|nr:TonB-dependent receptor [Phenylobacterium sp.]HKR87927.1 TonB-dependent receptor [Phenylobacterium sp.]
MQTLRRGLQRGQAKNIENEGLEEMRELGSKFQRASTAVGLILAAASYGGLGVAQAQAQTQPAAPPEGATLQEIVVTANKREENLQNVPIAITAVTGDRLVKAGVTSTQDLARVVPGLTIQNSLSGTQAHLRGVGTTALSAGTENSIATYIDGVYILSLSGALVQLNNISQIEVLKGPQGTLFGRNATGGVINIRTRDPSHDAGGDVNLSYANYNTVSSQFYLTGGITDQLAADIAGFVSHQGEGWGKNLFNGRDVNLMDQYAVRSKWKYEPTSNDVFRFIADFEALNGNAFNSFAPLQGTSVNYGPGNTTAGQRPDMAPFVASGALAPFAVVGQPFLWNGGFYDIDAFRQPKYVYDTGGVSLQWDHDFGNMQLTSITAYRRAYQSVGWASVPVPAFRSLADWHEKDKQISQELRLGSAAGAKIPWVVGLYYLDGSADYTQFHIQGTPLAPLQTLGFHAQTGTTAGAVFGQFTAPLWAGAHFTGGLRYNAERRSGAGDTVLQFLPEFGGANLVTGQSDQHATFKKLTWRMSLDQQLTPDLLGYVSYNRGFKSGLFNSIPPGGPPVAPELLDAYETGLKSELFDRRLRLNVAAFYYKYDNLQVTVFTPISATLQNGASARVYGGDLDFTAQVTQNLSLTGGATLLHSEFTSYPNAAFEFLQPVSAGGGTSAVIQSAKGKRLPYSPNFSMSLGVDYKQPLASGDLDLALNYSYSGKWFAGPDNILGQPGYGLLDGSATYTFGDARKTRVSVWAKNIANQPYYVFLASQSNPGGYQQGLTGAPRTFGMTVGYKF